MKILTLILTILFVPPGLLGRAQAAETRTFQVAIHPDVAGGPKFTVTNLSTKTLTACVFAFSVSSEDKRGSHMSWDAIIQGVADLRRGGHEPLEPGASMTHNLPLTVGRPLPDRIDIVASVWSDGTTIGAVESLNSMLDQRISLVTAYDDAISILQKGIAENWTRSELLAALDGKPDSLPIYAIRSTLGSGTKPDEHPQSAMQRLVEYFSRNLTMLRQAKPTVVITPRPLLAVKPIVI